MNARKITLDTIDGHDIYDIEEFHGCKYVNIIGFFWERSDYEEDSEGNHLSWAFTEGTHLHVCLDEFVRMIDERGVRTYVEDDLWMYTTQYQNNMTRAEAERELDCLWPRTFLPYSDLTKDTPCGRYVNCR